LHFQDEYGILRTTELGGVGKHYKSEISVDQEVQEWGNQIA
jgi:hypothetical protein